MDKKEENEKFSTTKKAPSVYLII